MSSYNRDFDLTCYLHAQIKNQPLHDLAFGSVQVGGAQWHAQTESNMPDPRSRSVLDQVKIALAILVKTEPVKQKFESADQLSWPTNRHAKPVIRGFVHRSQLFALLAPRSGQTDWREIFFNEFLKVKLTQRHLRTPQFVALLFKYGLVQAICESGLWEEQGRELLAAGWKINRTEIPRLTQTLMQTLSFEQLQGALFVWWYWTVSRCDCLLWQAVADQEAEIQGFLASGIWGLEKRIDNMVWGLQKHLDVNLQLFSVRLFCRVVDYLNRRYSKPFLVMPAPLAFLISQDDSLHPAHALYASAGSAFRVGLDANIVKLLALADGLELTTALQWVYMEQNLISQSKAVKLLQIPFSNSSSTQGFVVLNALDKTSESSQERWLSDRAALIWLKLVQVAHQDYEAGCFNTNGQGQIDSWAQISPAHYLNRSPSQIGVARTASPKAPSFKERSIALFQTLGIHLRYWPDLCQHTLPALSGTMQQSLSGMVLNHLRYPFQTHSLPGLKPACTKAQPHPIPVLKNQNSSRVKADNFDEEIGDSPDSMVDPVVQIESVVPLSIGFRQWLESAKGQGFEIAQAYLRCVQSGCDSQALEKLMQDLKKCKSLSPAWACAVDFITHKVNLLCQKLQTKTLKKVGELKPLFHYFLPAFDLCESQHEWSDVTQSFEAICLFYDQMLDTRFGQHSVRDQLASLILEFHKYVVSKYLTARSAVDLDLERDDLNLDPQPGGSVRVHFASPVSYRKVLDLITAGTLSVSRQEKDSLAILHILLYRLTLRRGEILALKLGDFFWAGFSENDPQAGLCQVIIRGPHLKSNCANRLINLHGLLTPNELALVHARYRELLVHGNWRANFFILEPIGVSLTQCELQNLPTAAQTQLNRLVSLWRSLPDLSEFTVHSYRHCAINNALVHLTLATLESQQYAVSLLPWMRDPEFSRSRNVEVTQSITGLPVSGDVRQVDLAFELIRLCGHLHFRTTRSTYIHLFPWLTLVALNRSHGITLSKRDWAQVLGLKGRANVDQRGPLIKDYGLEGDLQVGMPSAHLLVDCILRRLRKRGLISQIS